MSEPRLASSTASIRGTVDQQRRPDADRAASRRSCRTSAGIVPDAWAMPCLPVAGINTGSSPCRRSAPASGSSSSAATRTTRSGSAATGARGEVPVLARMRAAGVNGITLQTTLKNGIVDQRRAGPDRRHPDPDDDRRDDLGQRRRDHDLERQGRGHQHDSAPTVDVNVGALTVIWRRCHAGSVLHLGAVVTVLARRARRRRLAPFPRVLLSGQPVVTLALAVRRRRLRADRHADAAVRDRPVDRRARCACWPAALPVAIDGRRVDLRRRPARRCCRVVAQTARARRPEERAMTTSTSPITSTAAAARPTHRRDDHLRDLIEQVLFTAPGERVMRPDFGSGLLALVFEPNSTSSRRPRRCWSRARCSSSSAT